MTPSGVMLLPKTLLKTMWPDTENVEKTWVSFMFREFAALGSLARLGSVLDASWSVLEASWRVLEPSWRRLGGVLEASWSVLERLRASWRRLGASWRHLEASWSVLEPS